MERVRWDRLFDDLEGQLAAQARLELDAEVAERTRGERARIPLGERVHGALGHALVLRLRGDTVLRGVLHDSGEQWLLLEAAGRQHLVLTDAVLEVEGLGRPQPQRGSRRFAVGAALREISRDRRGVEVVDVDGGRVHGTIDAVGADFFDLARHPRGTARRAEHVQGTSAIPFAAVAAVVSA